MHVDVVAAPSYSVLNMNLTFGAAVPLTYRRKLSSAKPCEDSPVSGVVVTKELLIPAPRETDGVAGSCARSAVVVSSRKHDARSAGAKRRAMAPRASQTTSLNMIRPFV